MGHNWDKMTHLAQKNSVFENISKWFYLLFVLHLAVKSEKIPRADPVIWACITLDHDWAKIAHLVQTRIFQEVSHIDFYVIIVLYHAAKSEKKILRADSEIYVCVIFGHNLAKIAHIAQKRFFGGNFTKLSFIDLLSPLDWILRYELA